MATIVGTVMPAQLAGCQERLGRDLVRDGRQEPLPRADALDRVVPGGQGGRPGRVVALDPHRIHQPASDAGARLALRRDPDQDERAEAFGPARRVGHGGHRAHREPEQVERGQAERVHEGLHVAGEQRLREAVGDVPARPTMGPGVGQVDAERLADRRELGGEVLAAGRGRAVQHDEREPGPFDVVPDLQLTGAHGRHSGQASGLPSTSVATARSMRR